MNLRSTAFAIPLILGMAISWSAPATAASDLPGIASSPAQDPPAIAFLRSKGYSIGQHFDAGHGMTGWVVVRAGNPNVVFTPKDGQVALIGAMVDATGTNLTVGLLEHYGSNPGLPKAYDALGAAQFVALKPAGAARRIVYVVFDANCPYCSLIYSSAEKYQNVGVEFRWVPVAYLRPDSATRAAAIFSASDPVKALSQNEKGFDETKHEGGLAPATVVSADFRRQLDRNDTIMQSIDSTVTPTFIWKDDSGQVHQYQGLPPPEIMTTILGVSGTR